MFGFPFVYTASNFHRGVDVWVGEINPINFFIIDFSVFIKPLYSVIYLDIAKLDFRGSKYNN